MFRAGFVCLDAHYFLYQTHSFVLGHVMRDDEATCFLVFFTPCMRQCLSGAANQAFSSFTHDNSPCKPIQFSRLCMDFPDLLNDVPKHIPLSLSQINSITFCVDIEKVNVIFVQ